MKHLVTYKLFEASKSENLFPDPKEIEEIFYDLSDEGIIQSFDFIEMGYMYFPDFPIRGAARAIISDYMVEYPQNWSTRKSQWLSTWKFNSSWEDVFLELTPSNTDRLKKIEPEELVIKDAEDSIQSVSPTSFHQLLKTNIENGNIKAYPFMVFSINPSFKIEFLNDIINSLKRVYKATGFRPVREIWDEDHIDDSGNLQNYGFSNRLYLVKVNDEEYNTLTDFSCRCNLEKELVKHFKN